MARAMCSICIAKRMLRNLVKYFFQLLCVWPAYLYSVAGSVISTAFAHDANGNQTGANSIAITYASFNKPAQITHAIAVSFNHSPEDQRYRNPARRCCICPLAACSPVKITGTTGSVAWPR